jgi:hypothetical protein
LKVADVSKAHLKLSNYYVRDDGVLMIEVRPGQFVSETAARSGLVLSKVIEDIERIKSTLKRPGDKRPSKVKASQ